MKLFMVDNNHKSEDKSLILVEGGGTFERVFAIKATRCDHEEKCSFQTWRSIS